MESSTVKLVMLQGPRQGETLEFKPKSTIKIGRVVRGNNVTIKDDGISTKHLIIEFESGKWVIKDFDSSNGTLLNDYKLPPLTPSDLRHGDSVKIGEYTSIKVEIEVKSVENTENTGRLRRNLRATTSAEPSGANQIERGGSKKSKGLKELDDEPVTSLVGEIVESSIEIPDVELSNALSIAENRGRRGVAARTRAMAEDFKEKEIKNVETVVESKRRRGRPPKAKKINNGDAKIVSDMQDLPNNLKEVEDENEAPASLKPDSSKESVSASGSQPSSIDMNNEVDWEKISLEQWLDFLEVHLPVQIHEQTEKMIAEMEQTTNKFHDFLAQQKQKLRTN